VQEVQRKAAQKRNIAERKFKVWCLPLQRMRPRGNAGHQH